MGFFVHTRDDGRNPPHEYHPASAFTPKVGMALKMEEGKLAAASGTDEVKYISMCEREAACTEGELIPVIRAASDIIFETTAAAAMTAVNAGDKVTVHTDGMQVTATTTGGSAEVVYKDGDAAGDMVRVRFGPAATAAAE